MEMLGGSAPRTVRFHRVCGPASLNTRLWLWRFVPKRRNNRKTHTSGGAECKMIPSLMKSQKGNVIFVTLTPARDCHVTPLFYTHHLQLHAGRRLGGRWGGAGMAALRGEDVLCASVCRRGWTARFKDDTIGGDSNLPELRRRSDKPEATLAARHAGDLV